MKSAAPQSVDFEFPPAAGQVVMFHGQRYELTGVEPTIRRDAAGATLLVWRSHCANCADPFETRTGLVSKALSRRCVECKSPGIRA